MEVENRAGRAPSGRSSRDTLSIDPISDLLDMALGLDIYRSDAKKAAPASALGSARQAISQAARARARRQSEPR